MILSEVRVNIRSVLNTGKIRNETRNGREVIIAPSATLPDDIVMNGITYPAHEISKSFMGLENSPAPFGHPSVDGVFVSALDPAGINAHWIGAHNENVKRENGVVTLDKVIDVDVANQTENGKAVLKAISDGDPIHTSTGLLCELEVNAAGDVKIARNIQFDHDAILLNEEGAATPAQGVGMMVNKDGVEVTVVNSAIDWADQRLDWAVRDVHEAIEGIQKASLIEQMKSAILSIVPSLMETKIEESQPMSNDKLEELDAKVNKLTEAQAGIGQMITSAVTEAVKPILDAQAEIVANAKAAEDSEKAALVEALNKAGVFDEEALKDLTLVNLRRMAAKVDPKTATGLNSAFNGKGGDGFDKMDLNEAMGDKK